MARLPPLTSSLGSRSMSSSAARPETRPAHPRALRGDRRCAGTRRQPLDSRQARLPVSGPGIVPGGPRQVPRDPAAGPRARRAVLCRRAGGARPASGLCPFSHRAALPGWSTPSPRSAVPSRCWPTSGAIPTASLSATSGCSISTTAPCASVTATTPGAICCTWSHLASCVSAMSGSWPTAAAPGAPGPLPGAARPPEPPPGEPEPVQAAMLRLTGIGIQRCPYCAEGHLQRIVLVVPLRAAPPYSESDRTPTALMTTITRRSPRPLPRKPATVPFGLPQPLTRPCHLCHSALQGTSHQTETGEAVHAPHSHPTRHTPSGPNAGPPAYNPHRPVA